MAETSEPAASVDALAHTNEPSGASAVTFLSSLEGGRLLEDFDAQLREVVAALRRHVENAGGKPKASITLRINVVDDGTVVEVVGAISSTRPTPIRVRNICFRGPGDTLSPHNPRQLPLDLAAPAAAPAPVRTPTDAPAAAVRLVG